MALVNDLHHMTFLTADMDRLIAFYERIFDARVTFDREEEGGVRHAFIEIGPQTGAAVWSRCRASSRRAASRFSSGADSTTSR